MTRAARVLAALVALGVAAPAARAADWGLVLAPGGRSGCCYGLAANDRGVIVAGQLASPHEIAGRSLEPLGEADAFVARFDPAGRGVSALRVGSLGNDVAADLALAPDGGFDLVGQIDGPAHFADAFLPVTGHRESFLARYDATDACSWACLVPGSDDRSVRAVRHSAPGHALILGTRLRTFSSGAAELYVAEYVAGGDPLWSRRVFGGLDAVLATAPSRIYVGGTGETVSRTTAPLPETWPQLVAMNVEGEVVWRWIPDPPSDVTGAWGRIVAADADSNGCVVLGEIRGIVRVGEHHDASLRGRDGFLARIDTDGTLLWLTRFGSGADDDAFGLDLADDGTLWATGVVAASATFGPWTTSNRTPAAFLASFDSEGLCMSVRLGIGPGDGTPPALPYEVAATDDAVYVAGWFRRSLDWGAWQTKGGEDEQFLGRFDR